MSQTSERDLEALDKSNQQKLVERCKFLGWSLKYKFDGHALHSAFKDNDHQWIIFRNWESKTFRSLLDVKRWAESQVSET